MKVVDKLAMQRKIALFGYFLAVHHVRTILSIKPKYKTRELLEKWCLNMEKTFCTDPLWDDAKHHYQVSKFIDYIVREEEIS